MEYKMKYMCSNYHCLHGNYDEYAKEPCKPCKKDEERRQAARYIELDKEQAREQYHRKHDNGKGK